MNRIIGCYGGGLRELRRDLPELFDEKTTEWMTKEMQKTVLWEIEIITRKIYIMAGLIKINEKWSSFFAIKLC